MPRSGSRGSITLELALVIPLLYLVVWGGTALAYSALARASLQMTAMRAAREVAAGGAASRIPASGKLYAYGEFAETYGLPRPRVKMLVGRQGQLVVAGACYRVRAPIPQLYAPAAELPEIADTALQLAPIDDQTRAALQEFYESGVKAIGRGSTWWEQAGEIWTTVRLAAEAGLQDVEFRPTGGSFQDGPGLEAAVRQRCAGRGLVVSARAAFWTPSGAGGAPAAEPEDRGLKVLRLEPNPVDVRGTGPGDLRRVTMEVQASEPTYCTIRVAYRTRYSQAQGLRPPRRATDGDGVVAWTWNVGTATTAGRSAVTVDCDNGESATRLLEVIND